MRRAPAVVLALVLAWGASVGCEPPPGDPLTLEAFPAAFALRYCRRVYDCCLPADRSVASPGTDEDMCTAGMTDNARNNAEVLLSFGGIGYFADAAQRCLDVLDKRPCADIFEPRAGVLIACQDVFAGTRALDAACEDGRQCTSGACAGALCVAPVTCPADQIATDGNQCASRVALGQTCALSGQCPGGAGCVASACKMRGATGEPCSSVDDCAGACGPVANDSGVNACRPGYCVGQ
jgi:hypothetical protein